IGNGALRPWLGRLNVELENLLQAFAWCGHAEGGAELGLQLAAALRHFWFHSGLIELGYHETKSALTRLGAAVCNRSRADALVAAGHLVSTLRRYPEANEHGIEALSIAREIGDRAAIAEALRLLGYIATERGDDAAAIVVLQ